MENLILFFVGFIYGVEGVITIAIYKEVRDLKIAFEQILSQMQIKDEEETNNFM